MLNPYLQQYHKNEIETATPEKILVMLYDGAIKYLMKARSAMVENNIQDTHDNIIKCENIILEFINSLNMEDGGSLAEGLQGLYRYLYDTLVSANLNKDKTKVNEVLKHLTELRDTWKKAIALANTEKRVAKEKEEISAQNGDLYSHSDDEDDEDEKEDFVSERTA